jgi:hypothetical protein
MTLVPPSQQQIKWSFETFCMWLTAVQTVLPTAIFSLAVASGTMVLHTRAAYTATRRILRILWAAWRMFCCCMRLKSTM